MVKILIAEDESVERLVLESFLLKRGHEVVSCRDGIEAWDGLQDEMAPRLAILDWMMPGKDGIEICRDARKQQRLGATYIILLTGNNRKEDVVEGLKAGADDYITKPFDSDELHARVQVGVRVVELQEQLLELERTQVLAATAAAAAHEINQPLQAMTLQLELMMAKMEVDDPREREIKDVLTQTDRIGTILSKMKHVQKYATAPYPGGRRIVDLDAASLKSEE